MVIRSGGMYAARSIFAEVRLPTGSKNAFLADLPPGSVKDARGKSVGGIPQGGRKPPLRQLFRSLNSWNQKNGGQKALRFLIEVITSGGSAFRKTGAANHAHAHPAHVHPAHAHHGIPVLHVQRSFPSGWGKYSTARGSCKIGKKNSWL